MESETLRRTPLYDQHVKLGGKIVPFAGWELPVQYSGVIAEHKAVREKAGLFDVSHMGEVIVTGAEAEKAIDYLSCNDVKTLTDGKALYSAIINDNGGVVDDIIIYRFNRERFLICVNASNADKDFEWFTSHNKFQAKFENKSASFGQIALQGPAAMDILRTFPELRGVLELKPFHFVECDLLSAPVIVARTGYTGEDGVEIFIPSNSTSDIWQALLENGDKFGLVPAGLGARDSLRLESCYPLHGHELGDNISAIESGLGWITKFDKGDFFGKAALLKHKGKSPRSLIGFFVDDPGIARHGDKIFSTDGTEIGFTTSGTKTPTVDRSLGLALVKSDYNKVGTEILVEVRGKKLKSHIVKKPFYKRSV